MIVEFIDDHKEEFGVEPICRVLREHGLADRSEHLQGGQDCPPPVRAQRDAVVAERVPVVRGDPAIICGVCGAQFFH